MSDNHTPPAGEKVASAGINPVPRRSATVAEEVSFSHGLQAASAYCSSWGAFSNRESRDPAPIPWAFTPLGAETDPREGRSRLVRPLEVPSVLRQGMDAAVES